MNDNKRCPLASTQAWCIHTYTHTFSLSLKIFKHGNAYLGFSYLGYVLRIYLFLSYVCEHLSACLHVCMYVHHVCLCVIQKKVLDPLELIFKWL